MKEAPTPRAERALALTWPNATGIVVSGRADVLCVGPADWLVIAPDPQPTLLFRALEDAFEGSSFRVTNVSQALSRIQLQGPHARAVLSKACALDVDRVLSPGRSARTRFAGMPVIVCCTQPSAFECIVTLSYREYLRAWLDDAAAEFTC